MLINTWKGKKSPPLVPNVPVRAADGGSVVGTSIQTNPTEEIPMVASPKVISPAPFMGIIMLDTTFPRIKGDIGNPATFDFPVQYQVVKNASVERLVIKADENLIQPFIDTGRDLINSGAIALGTSCGFLALFHKALITALDVPVFSSSLLQVHLARTILKSGQKVGIITARKSALTRKHLNAIGIEDIPMAIQGMDQAREFTEVFIQGKTTLDEALCRREMAAAARELITTHPEVGPIVLECTNMPPYANEIRQVTGRLVFDVTTLINTAWASLLPINISSCAGSNYLLRINNTNVIN